MGERIAIIKKTISGISAIICAGSLCSVRRYVEEMSDVLTGIILIHCFDMV